MHLIFRRTKAYRNGAKWTEKTFYNCPFIHETMNELNGDIGWKS